MATMMRLQRHGKKGKPFFHIVIADGRAPRDGKFIEKIGTYNPIPNPAEINIKFDKALDWMQKGAQPSDTVRSILALKGVLHKHHLLKGVKKGAMTETEAEAKFQTWLSEKESKNEAALQGIAEKVRNVKKDLLDAEIKINEDREAEIAKKRKDIEDAKAKLVQEAAAAAAAALVAEEAKANEEAKVADATPVVEESKEETNAAETAE